MRNLGKRRLQSLSVYFFERKERAMTKNFESSKLFEKIFSLKVSTVLSDIT